MHPDDEDVVVDEVTTQEPFYGDDPVQQEDTMTDAEREEATAALVDAENAGAPSQQDIELMQAAPDPWSPDGRVDVDDPDSV